MRYLWILFVAYGALFIVLGVPLYQGRVKPNPLFGFKTKKTLSDPRIWYPVNRLAGLEMILGGGLFVLVTVVLAALGVEPLAAAIVDMALLVVTLLVCTVHGIVQSNRLQRSLGRLDAPEA